MAERGSDGSKPTFDGDVIGAEQAYIRRRRKAAAARFGTTPPVEGRLTDSIGLAFSGGGIRSASFNLGVLQALYRNGFLPQVDYLSTVSGGGFIGGSLSHALRQPDAEFPFPFPPGPATAPVEAPAVSYLRDNSNYLAPRGLLDFVRLVAVLLRGLIVNLVFVVAPLLALLAALVALLHGDAIRTTIAGGRPDIAWLTPWVALAALGWVVLYPLVAALINRGSGPGLTLRDRLERSYGGLLVALVVAAVLDAQPELVVAFHAFLPGDHDTTAAAATLSIVGSLMSAPVIAFLRDRLLTVGLVVAALLGLLLPLIVYLYLAHGLIVGDFDTLGAMPTLFDQPPLVWVPALAGVLLVVGAVLLDVNTTSMHGFYRDRLSTAYLFNGARPPAPAADLPLSELARPGSWGPYHIVNTTLNLQGERDPALRGRQSAIFEMAPRFVGCERTGYRETGAYEQVFPSLTLGAAVAISGAAAAPNMGTFTSPALVVLMGLLNIRLGVWVPNPGAMAGRTTRWRPGPAYLLREFAGRLNSAEDGLNVTDGGHLENLGVYGLLRRRCRVIVASDAEADPQLTGQALATVLRFARLDMGIEIDIDLVDIHLDDAGFSRRHVAVGRIAYPADPARDLPESTGWLVYLKSSVVGDEDPLITDYRIKAPTFPHESTADQFFSEEQFEAYRALGDHIARSLFSEEEGSQRIKSRPALLERWAPDLAVRFAPTLRKQDAFLELTASLGEIERQLAAPELAPYSAEIYPELGPIVGGHDTPEWRQQVQHVVNQQLQLMEDAFFTLRFDERDNWRAIANQGWRALFLRWSRSPTFRRAYFTAHETFSGNFQRFARVALGLIPPDEKRPIRTGG